MPCAGGVTSKIYKLSEGHRPPTSVGKAVPKAVASHIVRCVRTDYYIIIERLTFNMMRFQLWLFIALLLTVACNSKIGSSTKVTQVTSSESADPQPTPMAKNVETSVTDVIAQIPFLEKPKKSALLRLWKSVPDHEHYRAVEPNDFNIPHWVEKEFYWGDVARSTGWSSDYGEMSGAYGFIIFMVNKSITDMNRFSVLVFIERPGNRYTMHWIFRDKDLSRVNLRRHSGNVYFQEFREDGTTHSCDVQWDRKQGRWACDLG